MAFPKSGKWILIVLGIIIVFTSYRAFNLYNSIFQPNVVSEGFIYIPDGADFKQVKDSLIAGNYLKKPNSINWVAKKKNYPNLIKPGAYKLEEGWNNNKLIDVLRSGSQTPVKVTFNNVRFKENLAGKLSSYFQSDSLAFVKVLTTPGVSEKYGFTAETFPCMFIPNTYELYWTTTPEKFISRMNREYKKFWNEERTQKAGEIGFSPEQISTLASIVQEETIKEEEKAVVAGVYINRLKRGWPLQADPTVKYAVGDFNITRILNKHLEIDSPYNTYKYKGLPPGPINFPDISSIDAVLNYEKHKYLYFCAREDFSGYHNFAKTLREHNNNAAKYQRELNKRKIWK
jgi:UPF0755 protein